MKEHDFSFLITYEDVVNIAKKHRKTLMKWTVCAIAAGLMFVLIQPVQFKAKASFIEGGTQSSSALAQFINSATSTSQGSNATFMMRSEKVLQHVVEALGLQVHVYEGPLPGKFKNFFENIQYSWLGRIDAHDTFEFAKTSYLGLREKPLLLSFKDAEHFTLKEEQEEVVFQGCLGEEVISPEFSLTIIKTPKHLHIGKTYTLSLQPRLNVIDTLKAQIEICPDKKDKNILWLYCVNHNRTRAAQIVNQLAVSFLESLKQENNSLAKEQQKLLHERRAQLELEFDHSLHQHVDFLKESIAHSGFVEVKQQIELLEKPQQELQKRLVDLNTLEGTLKEVQTTYARVTGLTAPLKLDLIAKQGEDVSVPWVWNKIHDWSQQFSGVDLATAQSLYATYQNNLDKIEDQIDTVEFLLPKVQQEDFELNALSALAQDAVTNALVSRASESAQSLREEGNYSKKNLSRFGDSLKSQKKFIEAHLRQSLELYYQQAKVIQSKLATLRSVMLTLIGSEKEAIQDQVRQFQEQLKDVPERWGLEKRLEMHSEMTQTMVEAMAQVIEGNIIEHQMKHIGSKIIDSARIPTTPWRKNPVQMALLFALITWVGGYGFFFVKTLWKGLPLSLSSAMAYGLSVCGVLSFFRGTALEELPKGDMETLRKAIDGIEGNPRCLGSTVIAVVGSDQKGLSRNLAQLVSWQKKTVLVVDLSFSQRIPAHIETGLWHYLEEKTDAWQVVRQTGYDWVPSGATTRFATELMRRERFNHFLEEVKELYDRIILVSETPLDASETQFLLQKADLGIVLIDQEPYEFLAKTGIAALAKQDNTVSLVFKEV
ncbi:MAG: hypothetical protein KGZ30_00020 [Anaplasmataceae bacterium]|nr:hypothetical protein [Anaplasmataceae bacterium]